MMPAKRIATADGVELTWAVNYFSGFMLTLRLAGLLEKAPAARVVNVASIAMGNPQLTFNQFDGHNYRPWHFYITSKLAQAMMAVKLNQLFQAAGHSVMVNASSPGLAATSLKVIQSKATAWPMRLAAVSFGCCLGCANPRSKQPYPHSMPQPHLEQKAGLFMLRHYGTVCAGIPAYRHGISDRNFMIKLCWTVFIVLHAR